MVETGSSQTKTNPPEDTPTEASEKTSQVEAGAADVASEVQRVNRISEIENMDWERQLRQAVSEHFYNLYIR